jgi:3-oxoadipate enol-lactonase
MPVCQVGDININYRVYGEGFPLVLIHPFSASLEFWAPQIEKLSPRYRIIAYDVRGHGLSSAPVGPVNYTLDILVEDLHHLLEHLEVTGAYIGGLSLGGAIALGYAHRYPGTVRALLLCDLHGGFQPPPQPDIRSFMAERWVESERLALTRGMADLARHQIAAGTAFRPILQDKALQEQHIERMARCPVNGYVGIGRAKPWEAEWQHQAADNIDIPSLIIVGGDDEMVRPGAGVLHQHIKGSRYVEIKGSVHETARWCPDLFNRTVLEFLEQW